MAEEHHFHLKMAQAPLFDVDPHDTDGTRRWRMRVVEGEVLLLGRIPARIVALGAGVMRTGLLSTELDADRERAALFHAVGAQSDVVRAYREGELVREHEGASVRVVAILEYAAGSGAWWCAHCRVGTNAASIGTLRGDWVEASGTGLDALDEDLREWIDTSGIELGEARQELRPDTSTPEIWSAMATLSQKPPLDPKAYAAIVGQLLDPELNERYPDRIDLFAFHDLTLERFIVKGDLAVPLDDLVRAIAARGPTDAVAARYPGVAEIDGESFRSVVCTVECDGRLHDRVVAIKLGADGRPAAMRVIEEDRAVTPETGWLGKPPRHEVALTVLGVAGGNVAEG